MALVDLSIATVMRLYVAQGLFVLTLGLPAGCMTANVLPPRAAPPAVMPAVQIPSNAPTSGRGRLVVDTTDGPMDVAAQRLQAFDGASAGPVATGPLCRTPCVVDLPFGRYDLYLSGLASDPSRGDKAPVEVREGTNVLLRAPGKYEVPNSAQPGPIVLASLGGLLAGVSPAFIAVKDSGIGLTVGSAVIGVALLVAGLATFDYTADQQAGTSTFFVNPGAKP
jgi:hypothetical protein